MSLDIYLHAHESIENKTSGIFIRENGQTIEISAEEWNLRNPDREPVTFEQEEENDIVYETNITHNLGKMAIDAGIYEALWRPEEINKTKAGELIEILKAGLANLKSTPEYFKQFNPSNGWGDYDIFVRFVEDYLNACKKYPNAIIEISR